METLLNDKVRSLESIVEQINDLYPNEKGKLGLYCYGPDIAESYMRANHEGVARLASELLKSSIQQYNTPEDERQYLLETDKIICNTGFPYCVEYVDSLDTDLEEEPTPLQEIKNFGWSIVIIGALISMVVGAFQIAKWTLQ